MLIRTPEQDIERVLFTEKAIAARVEQLGADSVALQAEGIQPADLNAAAEVIPQSWETSVPCWSACSRVRRFFTLICAAA